MFLPSVIVGRVLNSRPWHSCTGMEKKIITAICDKGKFILLSCYTIYNFNVLLFIFSATQYEK